LHPIKGNFRFIGNLILVANSINANANLGKYLVVKDLKQVVSLGYYQPALVHLTKLCEDEIRFVLTQKYAMLRGELFLRQFEPGVPIDNQAAWNFAKEALDVLDARMGEILSKRSAAYWLGNLPLFNGVHP
jgi:hypothetical protein